MIPETTSFDAIVVGSGISGGWAAKELCEKGLKTLVLERGRDVQHIKDYPTMNLAPWELPHRGAIAAASMLEGEPAHQQGGGYGEDTAHFFVKDARPSRTCRRSRSTGSAATRSAGSRSSGDAPASGGASTSSSRPRSSATG